MRNRQGLRYRSLVFERYTESARRALFFARYEVTQFGGLTIEPEHLVLGILRAAPEAILRFAREGESVESIRAALAPVLSHAEKVSTSVEIPFASAAKDALMRAAVEADDAGNDWIGPEHVVLGILVKTYGGAVRALEASEVQAAAIREYLPTAPSESPDEPVQAQIPGPGTICRQWRGVVKPGRADEYLSHLRRETLPALAQLDGFLTFSVMRRDVEDGTEFQVMTLWSSLAAIEAFAGTDVTRAVVPPAAQALLVRYDDRATHYEIVE
jgi:heme-degrading monooxygenase HmoA